MTSLAASLPQEIVHHIVQFAAGTPDELDLNYRLTRYPLLRRCALVCRSFRPVAQALLWEKVDLKTLYQVAALRRTKGTWGRTRELRYDAIGATSKAQLKVLSLFPALEKLVYSRAAIEPEVLLALPSMAGALAGFVLDLQADERAQASGALGMTLTTRTSAVTPGSASTVSFALS